MTETQRDHIESNSPSTYFGFDSDRHSAKTCLKPDAAQLHAGDNCSPARIHGTDQHEAGRVGHRAGNPADGYHLVFQRLA